MDYASRSSMGAEGFTGFTHVRDLRRSRCAEVPRSPGVYLILRDPSLPPRFLETNPGGHFKGRNPSVSLAELKANWVNGVLVIYIGKAGGGTSANDLRSRLDAYMRFGAGASVGHWGGRLIWQIEGSDDFLVCWRPCHDVDAIDYECALIQQFAQQYGKRPFANLRN